MRTALPSSLGGAFCLTKGWLRTRLEGMRARERAKVSARKAKEILGHGEVHGRPLTKRQRGFFGLIAGGGRPTRLKE